MHYAFELEVPKNTTRANAVKKVCKVNYGILRNIEIFFPFGCAGWVYVQILRDIQAIFPTNIETGYADDNYHLIFEEYYPILSKPYELTLRGWSLDDRFSHTVYFKFLVIHPSAISTVSGTPITQEELAALLGTYEMAGGG